MVDLKTALGEWKGKLGGDVGDEEKAKIDAANAAYAKKNAEKKGLDTRVIDPSERQPYRMPPAGFGPDQAPPAPSAEQGEYVEPGTMIPDVQPRIRQRIFNASLPYKIRQLMRELCDNEFRTVQFLANELNGSTSTIQTELHEMEAQNVVWADKTRRPHRWYNVKTERFADNSKLFSAQHHKPITKVSEPEEVPDSLLLNQLLDDMEADLKVLQSRVTLIRSKITEISDPTTDEILNLLRKRYV